MRFIMFETPAKDELLWDVRRTAQSLNISERTLWSMTKAGEIPHIRIRRRVLFDPQDVKGWIAQQKKA